MAKQMSDSDPDFGRIRYADDVEAGHRRGLHRRDPQEFLSIRSVSQRRSVEPSVALPIQFRTL